MRSSGVVKLTLPLVAVAFMGVSLAACAGATPAGAPSPTAMPTSPSSSPSPDPVTPPATSRPATPTATPATCEPDACRVLATANIFGAGHKIPPVPGGGGRGTMPPLLSLPAGATRTVAFPSVSGQVNPIRDSAPWNGPGGNKVGPTDVESFEGISGILDSRNAMFFVGVFLSDAEPADPAPERLDFTGKEDFELLEPQIGQTFYIGDGGARRFRVPAEATRLFLGFADAYFYVGQPGYYNNNQGELMVTVSITGD